MTCDQIRADAAGLAALAKGDPEREAAWAHAAGCPGCLAELEAAAQIMAMLDALPPPPPPSAEALARASREILAELARPRVAIVVGATVIFAWGLLIALARHRAPGMGAWIESGAAALVAAAGAAGAIYYGTQVAAAIGAASALLAFAGGAGGGFDAGWHCLATELMAAALVAVPAVWLARTKRGSLALTVAAAGAFAGQAALSVSCPAAGELAHELVFHTSGVIALCVVAAIVARLTLSAPRQPRRTA